MMDLIYSVYINVRLMNTDVMDCCFIILLYSAYQKKVVHTQRPIVLQSTDFNICIWAICKDNIPDFRPYKS